MCTSDLGLRYVLVRATDGDLTGVALDDFSCHSARLTDEPFETGPGDGSMPGLLTPPEQLLGQLKRIA